MVHEIGDRLGRLGTSAVLVLLIALISLVSAAPADAAWTPEAASYGVGIEQNAGITMSDGTVLRADVYYPTNLSTGQEAAGSFPVLLTQTPYGKNQSFSDTPEQTYMAARGYIAVLADVRGTGSSGGTFGFFDPEQATDGATLARWASQLPHSDGKVGLIGGSYLGITQLMTAAAAGSNSPIKAIMPVAADDDVYRDVAFAGGFEDFEFDNFYLGLTSGLNSANPLVQSDPDATANELSHIGDLSSFDAALDEQIETGGPQAYDEQYWQARATGQYIPQIVHDKIPALLVGGWFDLFQRGEPLNYAAFQNAYDNRPLLAAMTPAQPVTPRYQLIDGPWYHTIANGTDYDYQGRTLSEEQLAWFDYWLKGINTGVVDTSTPLHLEDLGTGQWLQASRYPLNQTTPTTYYLGSGGTLSPERPTANETADALDFTGGDIPCTSSTDQWLAGLAGSTLSSYGLSNGCDTNSSVSQTGPSTQNYTTAPMTVPTTIAGPISATLYATANTTDTEWVVQLTDVAPDGSARPLTEGVLEGDQRAVDPEQSWDAPDGQPLLPYHPYTQAALEPVTPGQVTRYDIEVFPTVNTLEPGHRLRVTIATADFPHVLASEAQLPHLAGGIYELQHSSAAPSSIELPLAPVSAFSLADPVADGCPAASGKLTSSAVGPARLGQTPSQTRSAFASSTTSASHGRRAMTYFCLAGGLTRVGYRNGRSVLILSENGRYSLGAARVGAKLATVKKALRVSGAPIRIGRNDWYLVSLHEGRGVLRVRTGVIAELGIATPALVRTRAAAGGLLRSFG